MTEPLAGNRAGQVLDESTSDGAMPETPENAAEEAEDAAGVCPREGEAAEQQIEIVAIGLLHGSRGVVGGVHGRADDLGEEIEIAHGGGGGCRRQT